ncbi:MAG: class I SAM-dependent methyltransferase [Bacteroidetes bacterium]|nr:class I SAM-dependent methyltransferase [Bacteroidota bacterium]
MTKQKLPTPPAHTEWFQDWFNSPYYHLLYKNRDETEAKKFIDRLLAELKPPDGAFVLDLACGKGRYSRYLAEKGFDVTGLDIAKESILFAQQFENEHLTFFQHDMRLPFRINYFDYIFNFFTSFGYFEKEKDHLKTVVNIARGLRPEGKFVLDFFNSKKVISGLRMNEIKQVDEVVFHIQRRVDEAGYILKNIQFGDEGKHFSFTERVRAFTLNDFQVLFGKAGLKIARTFGSYQLEKFDETTSDRLILVGCRAISDFGFRISETSGET